MTEAWKDVSAQQAEATLEAVGLWARVQDALSANVLDLAGLVLIGCLIAVACTGILKRIARPTSGADRRLSFESYRLYTLGGMLLGAGWTQFIVSFYLVEALSLGLPLALITALGLAVLGAGATPYVYDLLHWLHKKALPRVGGAVIGWILRRFGAAP